MTGTDNEIDLRIWQVVALIPRGRVATYGDIARQAGMPGAARRVGRALRKLPTDTRIPWHRVLNSSGKISLPPDSRGSDRGVPQLGKRGGGAPGALQEPERHAGEQ